MKQFLHSSLKIFVNICFIGFVINVQRIFVKENSTNVTEVAGRKSFFLNMLLWLCTLGFPRRPKKIYSPTYNITFISKVGTKLSAYCVLYDRNAACTNTKSLIYANGNRWALTYHLNNDWHESWLSGNLSWNLGYSLKFDTEQSCKPILEKIVLKEVPSINNIHGTHEKQKTAIKSIFTNSAKVA